MIGIGRREERRRLQVRTVIRNWRPEGPGAEGKDEECSCDNHDEVVALRPRPTLKEGVWGGGGGGGADAGGKVEVQERFLEKMDGL